MMELRTLAVVLSLASVALCQDYKVDVSKVADEIKSKLPDYVVEPIKGDWHGIKASSFNVDPIKIAGDIKNKVDDWAGDKASFDYLDPIKAEDVAESKVNDYDLEPIKGSDADEIHVAGVRVANPAPAVEVGTVGTLTDFQYEGNNMNDYWQRLKELADEMKNSHGDESSDDSDESEDDSDDDSDESEGDDDVESIESFSNKDNNNKSGKNEDDSDESDEDDSEGDSDESDEGEKDGYNGFKFKIRLPTDKLTQWIQASKNAPADTLEVEDLEQTNEPDTFDDMIGEDLDMEEDGKTVSFDDWLKSVDYSGYKYDALFRPTTTNVPKLTPDYLTYRKQQAAEKDDDWWLYEKEAKDNEVQVDISYAREDAHDSVVPDGRRRELYTAWHYIFFSFSGVLFLLGTVVMVGGIIRMQRYRRPNYILLAESGKVPL